MTLVDKCTANGSGANGNGEDFFFYAEFPMIQFLEKNGYDISYASQIDVAQSGAASGACFAGRVSLGRSPSLHHLRPRSPGLVRRLRRYYGTV